MEKDNNKEIISVREKVEPVLKEVKKFKIKNDEGMKRAIDLIAMIKNRADMVEKKRKEMTQPINQALRTINKNFKPISEPLRQARIDLEDAIKAYRAKVAKENTEMLVKAQKKGEVAVKKQQVTSSGSSSIRVKMVPAFRLVDITKVPDKYKRLDEVAIRRDLRNGVSEIPGLEIYEEEQVGVYK